VEGLEPAVKRLYARGQLVLDSRKRPDALEQVLEVALALGEPADAYGEGVQVVERANDHAGRQGERPEHPGRLYLPV
jgi:hypothetical protein